LAEETGLIVPLGRWVLREACRQMNTWIDAGMSPTIISVNCSSVQFTRGHIEDDVIDALKESGLDPSHLEVEITEGLLLKDLDAGLHRLELLKKIGVRVALDDFGTGFTSLSYLTQIPVDKLKIDQSFVAELEADKGSKAIVSSIITLGHNLDMKVIAEGVETDAQYRILNQAGCDEIQGYFISYPLSAEEFDVWASEKQDATFLPKASGL